jgi:hypothetical protein
MRAQRIKTGFHRIGVVLAAVSILIGLAVYGDHGQPRDVAVGAGYGVALYAAMLALGWIVAGFVGDGERNSN